MLGRLRGILLAKQPPTVLLDVQGVGYEVDVPLSAFVEFPALGQELILQIHLVVREDAQLLYGFLHIRERELFRRLLKINGVGPKLALAILSSMDIEAFIAAVVTQDVSNLVRLPGVGRKTAERLIIELQDKLQDWTADTAVLQDISSRAVGDPIATDRQDAISALVALGYKPQQALQAVNKLKSETLSREELIKRALQEVTA